jgi:N-acetyl-anhydromuramyl-L-alanine amidase AmpD
MQLLNPWLTGDKRTRAVTTVILHWTAGNSVIGSIETLQKNRFSYHYILGRDANQGTWKCLPQTLAGRHTGFDVIRPSLGPDGYGTCNQASIGISFANRGDGELIREYQLAQLEEIVRSLKVAFPALKWLTTHHECAPLSRPDELKYFPLETWAERLGLEAWRRKKKK